MTWRTALVSVLAVGLLSAPRAADSPGSRLPDGLRWRVLGPNRAGRLSAVAGVPGDPTVYYAGTPDGGLWKTNDGGTVWKPVFDQVGVPSIGAIAVAASNPSVVYVGTGHNLLGKGVFRSADAGRTWQGVGLADTKYITALVVDSRDADTVLAAAGSGGNFGTMVYANNGPTATRGVYRTTDGGRTWAHVLAVDPASGVVDLVADPAETRVVYASFGTPRGPAPGTPPDASGAVIYRSEDGGLTWTRLPAQGLPAGPEGPNIAVAPGTRSRRLYALAGGRTGGLYRSDDGGTTWALGTGRVASASGHVYVDPKDPDVVYTMGTSIYRSQDGGRSLEAVKGAPGGDDPRSMWIDPTNPRRMIAGADQGPTITVNGGASWSPWYVMQNGEHYFVTTDEQFPYWVYAAQQDSGTVAIRSRSDYGAIRPADWYPVGGYEQGHVFADPLNPRFVYSQGEGHAVVRFDRETGQVGPIYVPRAQDRFGPRPAMALSPKDPHRLFLGAQYVLETRDRGLTWTTVSDDLTDGRGTLVALAPSPIDAQVLWAGSSNGLIHVTRDGGRTWKRVSPPGLASASPMPLWSMEASGHDVGAAYAAAIDLSDAHAPQLFRTLDFGETWQRIVAGLDPDVPTRVVREDPGRPTLLYAGTQSGAFVSLDRGDHWQPLQANLPRVAVNDITVHGNDLVIATWGRGLWVMDDVSPLRQVAEVEASTEPAFFFTPAPVVRVHWDVNQDTPLPPEVVSGQNPPDGAILYYYLAAASGDPVRLSITDARGELVREYSSAAPMVADTPMPNVPAYWFKPADADRLPATAGMHRFVWDLRYPPPPPLNYGRDGNPAAATFYGIVAPAILGASPRQQPLGPLVAPGTYRVRLTVGNRQYDRLLAVSADPRVTLAPGDLDALLGAQRQAAAGLTSAHDAIEALRGLRRALAERLAPSPPGEGLASAAGTFDRSALEAIGALAGSRAFAQYLALLEFADMRPTPSTAAALEATCGTLRDALARYRQVIDQGLPVVNGALAAARRSPLPTPAAVGSGCGPAGR